MCGVTLFKFRLEECNQAENMYFLKKMVLHSTIIILVAFLWHMFSCQKYIYQCAYAMLIIVSSEIMDKMISRHLNQEY